MGNILGAILLLLGPFLFSGNWTWKLGWIFAATMFVGTLASRLIGDHLHPGLQRERLTAAISPDTKAWDKWIVPLTSVWLPVLAVSLAGADKRFGWSTGLQAWANWLGLILIWAGFAFGTWAVAANPFFSLYVRIQSDRGHRVVTGGPYAIVRHPGYLGAAVAMIGIPLLLDSLWAFPPICLVLILGVLRTHLEDKALLSELPGYADYAVKVPYRLIPGIW